MIKIVNNAVVYDPDDPGFYGPPRGLSECDFNLNYLTPEQRATWKALAKEHGCHECAYFYVCYDAVDYPSFFDDDDDDYDFDDDEE